MGVETPLLNPRAGDLEESDSARKNRSGHPSGHPHRWSLKWTSRELIHEIGLFHHPDHQHLGAVGRHGQAAALVVIARLSGMPELVDRTKNFRRLAAVLLQLHSVFLCVPPVCRGREAELG